LCPHGDHTGNASDLTSTGYAVWIRCACGARIERWVTVEAARRLAAVEVVAG
jgi:hypothetical protein